MADIDPQLVRNLADILSDTGLTEIEVERGDLKIRVARQLTAAAAVAPIQHLVAASPAAASAAAPAAAAPTPPAAAARGDQVKSPMVGTVYVQAKPGDPPFCRPGDKVVEGQTLLIVEAMKTMNPIPAPRAGTVLEVLVGNEQPVEYGEPLIVLE
jgi:acetyl-CoA carboxylase biotin carboxyl carrier protein